MVGMRRALRAARMRELRGVPAGDAGGSLAERDESIERGGAEHLVRDVVPTPRMQFRSRGWPAARRRGLDDTKEGLASGTPDTTSAATLAAGPRRAGDVHPIFPLRAPRV